MIGYVVFVTGAGTLTRGNTLIYEGPGTLEGIQNLTTRNHSIIIRDNIDDTISAIFNAQPGELELEARSMASINSSAFFPNTSIGFFGDVDNFDDIDAFSRFKETNINNGTSASAGFSAVNDIGLTTNFGISSSNFITGGAGRPNQPTIISFSPEGFNYVNFFGGGWSWIDNPSKNFTDDPRLDVMNLSENGSLEILGNFTGNQFYGEMFGFHVVTPEVISIPSLAIVNSSGVFNLFNITNWTAGENNGFTFFNDTLIANIAGLYNAKFGVTYTDLAQGRHVFIISKNAVAIVKTAGAGYVSNANDIRSVTGVGLIRVEEGDVLQIQVGDRFNPPTDIEVLSSSFDLIRIGD